MYSIIGDCHLGFKAYDSNRRTEECLWTFERAISLCTADTILIPGDLLDDTVISNWVEKRIISIFHMYIDKEFIILAGNHDSTKTYNSVTALDVLAELPNITVLGNFKPHHYKGIIAIPHMKSQREFKEAILSISGFFNVCLLHSMVGSKLDLGPNDLNIDEEMLNHLMKWCTGKVYIGHQHTPVIVNDKVIITGAIMEFTFGELGPKYVYNPEGLVPIPQPRLMERIDITWSGIGDLLDRLYNLNKGCIYKVVVTGLPQSEYSACLAAIDGVTRAFDGDLIYELIKTGHEEINISTIDSSFDLKEEFRLFCEDNNYDHSMLCNELDDAISEIASEEEDV